MKLSKEQQLQLENIDLEVRANGFLAQLVQYSNADLQRNKQNLLEALVNEAREKEEKPEDKYNCVFDPNTYEITFTEKEEDDAVRSD